MRQYRIRIGCRLDDGLRGWFDDCSVTVRDRTTDVICRIRDQAGLYGILRRIQDLGMPLLEVRMLRDSGRGLSDDG
jgi:hypothetical protein